MTTELIMCAVSVDNEAVTEALACPLYGERGTAYFHVNSTFYTAPTA